MDYTTMSKRIFFKYKSNLMYVFPHSFRMIFQDLSAKHLDELFFKLLITLNIENLIECGANEASASMAANKMGINSLAIEPNPYTFHRVTPLDSDLFQKINVGLGRRHGSLLLYVPAEDYVSGSATFKPKQNEAYMKKKVLIESLDDILKNTKYVQRPYALWIDVEGMQREVLLGAVDTLQDQKCKLIKIEVEEEKLFSGQEWYAGDVVKFLMEFDFKVVYRDFEYSSGQYNMIFAKELEGRNFEGEKLVSEFISSLRPIVFKDCFRYLIMHKEFKREIKALAIQFFGARLGNRIASMAGSKASKDYIKKNRNYS